VEEVADKDMNDSHIKPSDRTVNGGKWLEGIWVTEAVSGVDLS